MAKRKTGRFFVGTSNIVVPVPKYKFPEAYKEKSRLCYYSSLLNSLEVNSTFYKLPLPRTFERWTREVEGDFRFTVKLSKEITHCKGLMYEPELISRFMTAAAQIGDKKGCLLIQFPASVTVHFMQQLEDILEKIQEADPENSWRKAIEFRHESWYRPAVYQLLARYSTVTVVQDMEKAKTPEQEHTEDFIYLRYHGPEKGYRGSYHPEHLEAEAWQIKKWLKEGKDVYAYFNNTLGDAYENAMMLRGLVERGST